MVLLKSLNFYSNRIYIYGKNCILKHSNRLNRLDFRTYANENHKKLSPYVSLPYSYAYGRSDKQLQYLTIGDLLTKRAESDNESLAFVSHYENISKTFLQLNEDVNKLAKGLHDKLGLRKGDVVGIWSCNSYNWIQVQYACARLGLILCTVNPVYRGPELNYALRKGQIKALFLPGNGSKQEIVNKYQNVFLESLKIPEDKESDELLLKSLILLDGENNGNKTNRPLDFHSFDSLIQNDGKIENSIIEQVSADDPAIIMFTSGTTGKPKGAYLSHFTLVNNSLLTAKSFGFEEEKLSMCSPLPFFHAFAAVLGGISMTAVPFKLVVPGLKYDVKLITESISKHECTHIICTPTMVIDMLNFVQKNGIKLTSLKGVLIGGAPVPVEVAIRISKVIPGCDDVRIGYGATELGPCTTASHKMDSFINRTETVGSPLDFVEVKIVDPLNGNITKIGEQGELLSRGHNVMIGYWRDEQKTKESINESNWYKSGDLAVMDELGYVKIIGRTKELIIRGGENVYPREVEELLHTHPDVLDVYVIGVPDERMGEEICAWITLKHKNSKITAEEIRTFCKDKISYFKVPRYVLFVDEFPLTSTGKAKKFEMREKSCEILGLKEL